MTDKPDQKELIKQLRLRDRVVRVMSKDGKFRVVAIKNTKAAQTAQEKHNLPAVPAFMLARLMSGASLSAAFLKGEERVILETESNGPIHTIYAEALQLGEIRGFIEYSDDLFKNDYSTFEDVIGIGLLKFKRMLYDQNTAAMGVVEIRKGDIASDLAYYYVQSEQIPTAVILDTQLDDDGKIKQSGGLIVQGMPGATDEDLEEVYNHLTKLGSISAYYDKDLTPDKMLQEVLPFEFELVKSTQLDFFCRCSKDQFTSKLATLQVDELKDMRKKGQNELVCQYCSTKYTLDDADFDKIIEEVTAVKN
ncbi:MAG: Hsp33 family molecular chaperone HslO [Candidatus Kapabacteria bacterium]|nr:Hsp33 family molecular chaperone HslO [Candidatus Kapabacteria bacterium]